MLSPMRWRFPSKWAGLPSPLRQVPCLILCVTPSEFNTQKTQLDRMNNHQQEKQLSLGDVHHWPLSILRSCVTVTKEKAPILEQTV